MKVVLIGSMNELQDVKNLLGKTELVDNTVAFERFLKGQKYITHQTADLVLLDADDDETGWEVSFRRIREANETAKVVLVSRDIQASIKAYELGVWDYLLKPVKRKQLERVIRKALKYS